MHHGDMRYLTRCKQMDKERYADVRVLNNPNMFDRTGWWFRDVVSDPSCTVADHSIEKYEDKLIVYATRRNRERG